MLASVALVLLATIIGFFSWGVDSMISELNRALKSTIAQEKPGFDLTDAAKLDLRGLMNGNAVSTDAVETSSGTSTVASTTAQ